MIVTRMLSLFSFSFLVGWLVCVFMMSYLVWSANQGWRNQGSGDTQLTAELSSQALESSLPSFVGT